MKKTRPVLYLFGVLTLLAAIFPMLVLPKYSFDEYFTINLVRNSWSEVIRLTALDVHPPLYYLAVKLVVSVFGENFFSWHFTSLICFLLLLLVTEKMVSKHFGDREAALCVLALCSAPNMLRYFLQVRMYSMAMLFVTLAFFLNLELIKSYEEGKTENGISKRTKMIWLLLGFTNVCAAYTHYFAGVAVVGLSLFLIIYLLFTRKNKKQTLLCFGLHCVGMAILYLPWLLVMVKQMQAINGNYWISGITLENLYGYLEMFFFMQNRWLMYGLCIVLFYGAFTMITGWRKQEDFWKWSGLFAAGFFLVFGVGYSVVRTPILIDRYLVVLLPMVWISIVLCLVERREKWIEIGLLILFCLCFMENRNALYEEYQAVENREETNCLKNNVNPQDFMYQTNVQRLAERAAFLPDIHYVLQEGSDEIEAFHYWTEMIPCTEAEGVSQVIELAEASKESNVAIWCENGELVDYFLENGWQVEQYPAWSVTFYRFTKE